MKYLVVKSEGLKLYRAINLEKCSEIYLNRESVICRLDEGRQRVLFDASDMCLSEPDAYKLCEMFMKESFKSMEETTIVDLDELFDVLVRLRK